MNSFQPLALKQAAIELYGNHDRLAVAVKEQLMAIDDYSNGILCSNVMTDLFSVSYELENEGNEPDTIAFFNNTLWKFIHNDPHAGYHYNMIMREAFNYYESSRLITEQSFSAYFKYIDMNTWFQEWCRDSLIYLADENSIKKLRAKHYSIDHSVVGLNFVRNITADFQNYFFKHANYNSFSYLVTEICRSIFAEGGSYRNAGLLKRVFIERPDVIESANKTIDSLIKQMEHKNFEYDFFDNEFNTCVISFIRSKQHTLRYAIKLARIAAASTDDLVHFLNKTHSDVSDLLAIACPILKISPFDLLNHEDINNHGRQHCMKALSE